MTCRHLTVSASAVMVETETGDELPSVQHLCMWADAHPERLRDFPRWLQVWALSGGPTFKPERDCPRCPSFEAEGRRP